MHFDGSLIEKWNSGGTLFITTTTFFVTTTLCTLIRFVWPSQERRRTCLASSHSATGARPTGLAPPMATRSLGAQQSESSSSSLQNVSFLSSDIFTVCFNGDNWQPTFIVCNYYFCRHFSKAYISVFLPRVDRYGNHQLGNWGDCNLATCMQRNDNN